MAKRIPVQHYGTGRMIAFAIFEAEGEVQSENEELALLLTTIF
jgi:hypothetical protein